MDPSRFDDLIRRLPAMLSRRQFGAAAAALLLSGLSGQRRPAAACDPNCEGKACGGDGCGGSCGDCPAGSACIDDLGLCVTDPPVCQGVGESCGGSVTCCDLLDCVDGICSLPECVFQGSPCGPGATCCEGSSCLLGVCVLAPPTCAPTGGSCKSADCCKSADTCVVKSGGTYICVRTSPVSPSCAHPGERPDREGAACCRRLVLQRGRCVIRRGDPCDRKNGTRAPCVRGSTCRGGRHAVKGRPICVPA